MSVKVTIEVLYCVSGDGHFDGHNGLDTHSVHQSVRQNYIKGVPHKYGDVESTWKRSLPIMKTEDSPSADPEEDGLKFVL